MGRSEAEEKCPIKDKHTPMPPGRPEDETKYRERLQKTHFQQVCPGCGLWSMWVLKVTIDFEGAVLRG